MDVSAEADAFLQGLQEQTGILPGAPADQAGEPSAADLIAQAQAAAASLSASLATPVPAANGSLAAANGSLANGEASTADEERRKKRRNRWGNPAADVQPNPVPQMQQQATPAAAPTPEAPASAAAAAPAASPAEQPAQKKRRSRWEDPDGAGETAVIAIKPKELVLPGGIKVKP